MPQPVFDAAGYWRVDLEAGSISSRDARTMLLVPAALISSMKADDLTQSARAWGEAGGRDLASSIALAGGTAGVEALAEHLAGSLAVSGLGRASVEVRGDALLVRVAGLAREGGDGAIRMVEGFLGGYLSALFGAGRFEATHIERAEGTDLFFCGSANASAKVAAWVADGVVAFEVLDMLALGEEAI